MSGSSRSSSSASRSRLLVPLPREEREFLAEALAGKRGLGNAVLALVRDVRTLFNLPGPVRELLEHDKAQRGLRSNRAYLHWLVMERFKVCAQRAEGDR